MADPVSIGSAAVGFAAFVFDVPKTITTFVQDAAAFPDEFKKLSLAINEFNILVRRLIPVFEMLEAKYGAECRLSLLLIQD